MKLTMKRGKAEKMTVARDKKTRGETKVLESDSSRTTHTNWCLAACPWKFLLANTQSQTVNPRASTNPC